MTHCLKVGFNFFLLNHEGFVDILSWFCFPTRHPHVHLVSFFPSCPSCMSEQISVSLFQGRQECISAFFPVPTFKEIHFVDHSTKK